MTSQQSQSYKPRHIPYGARRQAEIQICKSKTQGINVDEAITAYIWAREDAEEAQTKLAIDQQRWVTLQAGWIANARGIPQELLGNRYAITIHWHLREVEALLPEYFEALIDGRVRTAQGEILRWARQYRGEHG